MCEISVVIPVYNKGKYLENTIKCVLNQTYEDFELILVNDGSTDASEEICNKVALQDSRIIVFHTLNRGVSAARNLGIRNSNGKYICFIDADDYIFKYYLEELHMAINNNSDMSICDYYEDKDGLRKRHGLKKRNTDDELYEVIQYDLLCVLWNKLFVKNKIKHLFNEKISTCEDSIFCIQYYLDNNAKIGWINKPLYYYKVNDGGLTRSFQLNSLQGIKTLLKYNIKLANMLQNEALKRFALYHISKVYFYGVYTYIFENICADSMTKDKWKIISDVINDRKYQKVLLLLLKFSLIDNKAERLALKEYWYIIFSLLKIKWGIYFGVRIKKYNEKDK